MIQGDEGDNIRILQKAIRVLVLEWTTTYSGKDPNVSTKGRTKFNLLREKLGLTRIADGCKRKSNGKNPDRRQEVERISVANGNLQGGGSLRNFNLKRVTSCSRADTVYFYKNK